MADTKTSCQFLLLLVIFSSGFLYLETVRLGSCDTNHNVSCTGNERKALLKFKAGLIDDSLGLSSWVGKGCCQWDGVQCSGRTGHVTKLKLGNRAAYALGGQISPSLLDLKHLTYLDLSMNNFEGIPIPDFIGSLTRLRYLNLSGASFGGTIPPNLGNLSRLLYLDLNSYSVDSNENELHWLSGLSSLKHLNLGSIDLSKAKNHWLQAVNMLPSLQELHLPACGLSILPPSVPRVNLTFLSVLDLSNNGFNSSIPSWLFNLTDLVYVDLSSNNLQGELPDEFADLTLIKHIDLSENSFIEGKLSRRLGKLCNLRVLDLSFNKISGEITEFTDTLSECTNCSLNLLHLGYNKLGGFIPESLGYLKNLKYLRLMGNSFSGSIPESIGNLSSLKEFYLSENGMRGTIPVSLGQLSSLVVLDIKNNQWEGIITEAHLSNLTSLKQLSIVLTSSNITLIFNVSSDWIPPFKLTYLNLKSCQVGPRFPNWLRNQNELKYVAVWHAKISGAIPNWFWKLNLVLDVLDFSYNQLTGTVPTTITFSDQAIVFLNYNRFTGPLPVLSSNVSSFHLDNNLFSGPIPEDIGEQMPLLTDVDLSFNSLNGTIPLSMGKLNSLLTLVLSNNHLTGKIPDFWNNIPDVYVIDMSNNSLSGKIPSSLGSLSSSLKFLTLSYNHLSGKIPSTLKNCTNINTLNLGDNKLSGKIPTWIGERIPSLLILSLRSNLFYGKIPSKLCKLSSLHLLDLAHNNLSGSIPSCVGNLSGMASDLDSQRYEGQLFVATKGREYMYDSTLYLVNSIDLSANSLSGEVPDLTNVSRLGILNLSMNHLTGKIPDSIGSIQRLETLDLSRNKLSGAIPSTLTSSTFLAHLNLSYNNLSGEIPSTNQFQTLTDPSIYEGNPALCGSPLPNSCNKEKETSHFPSSQKKDDEDEDFYAKPLFYNSIVLGFVLGFWGVCGTLIVKNSWRVAYFRFVDDMKDRLLLVVSLRLARLRRLAKGEGNQG
ncbi:hypothetical protein ACOSP7_001976 [Xanthoceras sorbifolium]